MENDRSNVPLQPQDEAAEVDRGSLTESLSSSISVVVATGPRGSIILLPTDDSETIDLSSSNPNKLNGVDEDYRDNNEQFSASSKAADNGVDMVVFEKPKKKSSGLINIYTYCALISFLEFWYFFYLTYQIAVMTSIEKRYGWPSIFSGFFLSCYEIGHVTIVIFSFTETNINIPRRLALRSLLMAVGSLIAAAPHFVIALPKTNPNSPMTNQTNRFEMLDCFKENSSFCSNSSSTLSATAAIINHENSSALLALVLLVISQLVYSAASSTVSVIGVIYIDNNVDRAKSSTLIGVVSAISMLGPAAAFFFSSWAAGFIYVHPTDPAPPSPESPEFVGAWWIGFVGCAAIFALTAPFFLFFPMKFDSRHHHHHHHRRRHSHHKKQSSSHKENSVKSSGKDNAENLIANKTNTGQEDDDDNEKFTLRTIPRNFVILFRNFTFLALVFMASMQAHFVAGFFTFFPKYLESQFLQTTQFANVISGLAIPIPCAVGTFLGGWLMTKFKTSKSRTFLYLFFISLIVSLTLLLAIVFTCNHDPVLGMDSNGNASQQCGCQKCSATYQPVCTSDGQTYVSPCLSGCQKFDTINRTYAQCGCSHAEGNNSLYSAVAGRCIEEGESSSRCFNFYIYTSLTFLLAVVYSLPTTPSTIVTMRVVGEKYKSWAIGLMSTLCSFLGYIPSPVIYGAVFDAHCLFWTDSSASASANPTCSQKSDGADEGPKSCAVYETNSLAIWFHVVTSAFIFISLPANFYAWWKCRQQEQAADEKPAAIDAAKNVETDDNNIGTHHHLN